jgi:hypothetical protein
MTARTTHAHLLSFRDTNTGADTGCPQFSRERFAKNSRHDARPVMRSRIESILPKA